MHIITSAPISPHLSIFLGSQELKSISFFKPPYCTWAAHPSWTCHFQLCGEDASVPKGWKLFTNLTTSVTGWWGERWGESTARGAGRLRSPPDPDPGRGPAPRGCARVLSPGRWTRPAPARGGRQRRVPWRPRSPGRQVRLACQAVGLWICTERAGWLPESVPDSGLLLFTVGTPGMMGTGMAALFLRNGSDPYTE